MQQNKTLETIRAGSVKRILGELETLAKGENYEKFWSAFGRVLKEGVIEDSTNKERIAKLLRFSTTLADDPDANVGLTDYISRMKEGEDSIYYIVTDSFATACNSPHLEYFRSEGIEVLLMHDPVDEWLVSNLAEFDGKLLKSITHVDAVEKSDEGSAEDAQTDDKADDSDEDSVIARVKSALAGQVEDVCESKRLTTSPARLVSAGEQMSANLERLLQATGQDVPSSKRILELNVGHPLVQMVAGLEDGEQIGTWSNLLYDQSILAEGGKLEDPAGFVKRMNEAVVALARQGD